MFQPLRLRNYRLWAGADLVSTAGTWMQVLGLNWAVLHATGSATGVGITIMLQSLPVLLLGGWGGALADRLPARGTLIVLQAVRALLALALLLHDGPWLIYAVALASGVAGSLEGPVLGRFGSALVPASSLGPALALGSVLSSAGRITGMALGGVLVGLAGPATLYALNAASYLAVIAALAAMRTGQLRTLPTSTAEDRGTRAGLRYLAGQPAVPTVLAIAFILGSLGRNYQVSMAAMISGPLHGTPADYGLLSAVFAIGAVAGGLLLAGSGNAGLRTLIGAGLTMSILQLCSALTPTVLGFAATILPIAAAAVIFDTVVWTRVQLDTREDMRGRIIAATGMVGALSGIVGAPAIGWLSDTLGPRGALLTAGSITTAAALIGGFVLLRAAGLRVPAAQPA